MNIQCFVEDLNKIEFSSHNIILFKTFFEKKPYSKYLKDIPIVAQQEVER